MQIFTHYSSYFKRNKQFSPRSRWKPAPLQHPSQQQPKVEFNTAKNTTARLHIIQLHQHCDSGSWRDSLFLHRQTYHKTAVANCHLPLLRHIPEAGIPSKRLCWTVLKRAFTQSLAILHIWFDAPQESFSQTIYLEGNCLKKWGKQIQKPATWRWHSLGLNDEASQADHKFQWAVILPLHWVGNRLYFPANCLNLAFWEGIWRCIITRLHNLQDIKRAGSQRLVQSDH